MGGAILNSDLESVKKLLAEGVDPNAINVSGLPALTSAKQILAKAREKRADAATEIQSMPGNEFYQVQLSEAIGKEESAEKIVQLLEQHGAKD